MSSFFTSTVLFGSSNTGKVSEVRAFARERGFEAVGLNDESLQAFGSPPIVPEVAVSYEGNAKLKGLAYSRWARRACITDDTGLEIEQLGGYPGIFTANVGPSRVLEMLEGRPVVAARFVCCMVYTEPSGRSVSVIGSVEGELRELEVLDPAHRLPFSRFFFPNGSSRSLEVLNGERSYSYSHRYRAFDTLVRVLS